MRPVNGVAETLESDAAIRQCGVRQSVLTISANSILLKPIGSCFRRHYHRHSASRHAVGRSFRLRRSRSKLPVRTVRRLNPSRGNRCCDRRCRRNLDTVQRINVVATAGGLMTDAFLSVGRERRVSVICHHGRCRIHGMHCRDRRPTNYVVSGRPVHPPDRTALQDGPMPARDIVAACDCSRPTVYRRTQGADGSSVVTTSMRYDPDGLHRLSHSKSTKLRSISSQTG